jgi:hypothetical protein
MRYLDFFKSFDGTRWRIESDIPWYTIVSSKLADVRALTFKTSANFKWEGLPSGAAHFFMLRFNLIDQPMRSRGHV